ncbi:iron ABC transporter permease [Desulfonema ishimotonii]|uniref:Iron ABC transporter permease n=1 Tax=Desulfonema ishimotonii TaxID=45657 RepID=A0A401G300_9BACT|nr:iron ABC transporter permease [Desulfonema ishimotonii]GBC63610.1 iron ABC transporter permease [Desulfonema ishimotonii]
MSVSTARMGGLAAAYTRRVRKKHLLFLSLMAIVGFLMIYAVTQGAYRLSPSHVLDALAGRGEGAVNIVVWNIRLPRIIAAIVAGWGLAISGLALQTLLRNPLASPFTLGISHGAAFGAAFAIVVFGAGGMQGHDPAAHSFFSVTAFAFLGAMSATLIILMLSRLRKMSPESLILAGMALSSLFISGTILIQFLATEVELASVVFWTFGDMARSDWPEIGLMTGVTVLITLWLLVNRWNLNALISGDEVARGLGVEVDRIRLRGMFAAAFVAALVTAFHGVIAFLGLLAPHIARRLVGADHRLMIPFSAVLGALILLLADTAGRVVIGSGALPVGVLTSFLGAPLFLWLLIRGYRR